MAAPYPDGGPSDSSPHRKLASNHKAQASSVDKTEAWPSAVIGLQAALVPVVQAVYAPVASVVKQVVTVLAVSVLTVLVLTVSVLAVLVAASLFHQSVVTGWVASA